MFRQLFECLHHLSMTSIIPAYHQFRKLTMEAKKGCDAFMPTSTKKRRTKKIIRSRSFLSPVLKRILTRCFEEKLPLTQIAKILKLSYWCVLRRHAQFVQHGSIEYTSDPIHPTPLQPSLLSEIVTICDHLYLPTALDIVSHLSPESRCSISTCRRALKQLGYTYKKVVSVSIHFNF